MNDNFKKEFDLVNTNPLLYFSKYPFTCIAIINLRKSQKDAENAYQNRVKELMSLEQGVAAQRKKIEEKNG